MMSVPYALQANGIKMKTSATGDTLYTGGGNYLIIPGVSILNLGVFNPNLTYGTISDVEGNSYKTITIGNQTWMAENLKVSKYRNGTAITTNFTDLEWQNATTGAYAIYGNNATNNSTFGKLYNWYAVSDSRGLCPAGWHVPTDPEWSSLEDYLGGYLVAGGKLKSLTSLWASPNSGASNSLGFSGLPGGARAETSSYFDLNSGSYWWTSSPYSSNLGWFHFSHTANAASNRNGFSNKGGFSVRCLKD
jgi:uncharacterized protein (TIGR02145 family)